MQNPLHGRHRLHQGQPFRTAGPRFEEASAGLLMLHGRGATAESILSLAEELDVAETFACAAPQAAGHTWYPYSFLASLDQNEPWLTSALAAVSEVLARFQQAGIPPERTVLLGFSQGACLALEYAARHARHYGGVVGLSGGVIGPDGTPRAYEGSLEGTPVFLGCSDVDPHIPVQRVHETADVMERLGAEVTARIYPGMGHTINHDELDAVRSLLAQVAEVRGEASP